MLDAQTSLDVGRKRECLFPRAGWAKQGDEVHSHKATGNDTESGRADATGPEMDQMHRQMLA